MTTSLSKEVEVHASAVMVVLDTYPCMMREIISNQWPPKQVLKLIRNEKDQSFMRNITPLQQNMISKLDITGYTDIDISCMYKLIRHFNLLPVPGQGWGNKPSITDTNEGDDVERMRIYRNNILHRPRGGLSQQEGIDFFQESICIARRLDILIGSPLNGFVDRIKAIQCFSVKRTKYIEALEKCAEYKAQLKETNATPNVQLYYGNDIKVKLESTDNQESSDESSSKFSIFVRDKSLDVNAVIQKIDHIKESLARGSFNIITLDEAEIGSLILHVSIPNRCFATTEILHDTLQSFLHHFFLAADIQCSTGHVFVVVLTEFDGYTTDDDEKKNLDYLLENPLSILKLDVNVQNSAFQTENVLYREVNRFIAGMYDAIDSNGVSVNGSQRDVIMLKAPEIVEKKHQKEPDMNVKNIQIDDGYAQKNKDFYTRQITRQWRHIKDNLDVFAIKNDLIRNHLLKIVDIQDINDEPRKRQIEIVMSCVVKRIVGHAEFWLFHGLLEKYQKPIADKLRDPATDTGNSDFLPIEIVMENFHKIAMNRDMLVRELSLNDIKEIMDDFMVEGVFDIDDYDDISWQHYSRDQTTRCFLDRVLSKLNRDAYRFMLQTLKRIKSLYIYERIFHILQSTSSINHGMTDKIERSQVKELKDLSILQANKSFLIEEIDPVALTTEYKKNSIDLDMNCLNPDIDRKSRAANFLDFLNRNNSSEGLFLQICREKKMGYVLKRLDTSKQLFQSVNPELKEKISQMMDELSRHLDMNDIRDAFFDRGIFSQEICKEIEKRYPESRYQRTMAFLMLVLKFGNTAWVTLVDVLYQNGFPELASTLIPDIDFDMPKPFEKERNNHGLTHETEKETTKFQSDNDQECRTRKDMLTHLDNQKPVKNVEDSVGVVKYVDVSNRLYFVDDELLLHQFFHYLLVGPPEGVFEISGVNGLPYCISVPCLERLLETNMTDKAVDLIKDVFINKRALYKTSAINALAIITANKCDEIASLGYSVFSDVCTTSEDLFKFICFAHQHKKERKWTELDCSAMSSWYNGLKHDPKKLAFEVTKERFGYGWSHKAIIHQCHVEPVDNTIGFILTYITEGLSVAKKKHDESKTETDANKSSLYEVECFLSDVDEIQNSTTIDTHRLCEIISEKSLDVKHIPISYLNQTVFNVLSRVSTQKTFFFNNLQVFEALGFAHDSFLEQLAVITMEGNKFHPLNNLIVWKEYKQGRSSNTNMSWSINTRILKALESGFFYNSFCCPSGKKICLAIDISREMRNVKVLSSILNGLEASVALMLSIAHSERQSEVTLFDETSCQLTINYNDKLNTVLQKIEEIKFSDKANILIPIMRAASGCKRFDVFIIFTVSKPSDNDNYLSLALKDYRLLTRNPYVQLVTINMSRTYVSFADPSDPLMADFIGVDGAVNRIISSFIGSLDVSNTDPVGNNDKSSHECDLSEGKKKGSNKN